MIARRSVWSDAEVQKLVERFVPVADEVGRLQRGRDLECRIFRGFCEEGHYGGRTKPTPTRQGIYACTPAGKFLASCNTRRPRDVARMLERALERWRGLSDGDKTLAAGERMELRSLERWEDRYPAGGLVLRVTSRDLEGAARRGRWHRYAWNRDWAWFTRDEARSLVPQDATEGAMQAVPDHLVRRLARCHLVDNVRGQTPAFQDGDVEVAELTSRVVSASDAAVELELSGRTKTAHRGRWSRGVTAALRGKATWDRAAQRFTAFELVAAGRRWGRTQYNSRRPGEAEEPVGFVLELAADAADRVAPAAILSYGWR